VSLSLVFTARKKQQSIVEIYRFLAKKSIISDMVDFGNGSIP
jgi:hypothetical protein